MPSGSGRAASRSGCWWPRSRPRSSCARRCSAACPIASAANPCCCSPFSGPPSAASSPERPARCGCCSSVASSTARRGRACRSPRARSPTWRQRVSGLDCSDCSSAAFGVGFVIGPAIGGLAALGGPHVPFFVAGTVALVNGVVAIRRLPETHRPGTARRALPARGRRGSAATRIWVLAVAGFTADLRVQRLRGHVLAVRRPPVRPRRGTGRPDLLRRRPVPRPRADPVRRPGEPPPRHAGRAPGRPGAQRRWTGLARGDLALARPRARAGAADHGPGSGHPEPDRGRRRSGARPISAGRRSASSSVGRRSGGSWVRCWPGRCSSTSGCLRRMWSGALARARRGRDARALDRSVGGRGDAGLAGAEVVDRAPSRRKSLICCSAARSARGSPCGSRPTLRRQIGIGMSGVPESQSTMADPS